MKHLNLSQTAALLEAPESPRNRLFLRMVYEHGFRVSEALALTPSRVKNGFLVTRPQKNGKTTTQKLQFTTLLLWNEFTKNLQPNTRLFPFTRQWASAIFHEAARKAGITLSPKQGIHTLRHSLAHHLLDSGAPLPVVQRKLGHRSLASTGQYLLASDDEADRWTAKVLEERTA